MLIKTRKSWEISENQTTTETVFSNRRAFMRGMIGAATIAGTGVSLGQSAIARQMRGLSGGFLRLFTQFLAGITQPFSPAVEIVGSSAVFLVACWPYGERCQYMRSIQA